MVEITLKDGSKKSFESGSTILEIAGKISRGLAKNAMAAKFDDRIIDLTCKVEKDGMLEIITFDDQEGKNAFRHTSSHILAQAVKRLFPGTKLGIGPAIADGFYYDFDSEHVFTPEDLHMIEQEMEKIIREDHHLERAEMPREEAISLLEEQGEKYKVELIGDLPEEARISIYKQGEFLDLCAGPHIPSTGKVKAIKLTSLAGAYWRGNEKNKMLQRIYGTSFPKRLTWKNICIE